MAMKFPLGSNCGNIRNVGAAYDISLISLRENWISLDSFRASEHKVVAWTL
jgi:hypothetical protein